MKIKSLEDAYGASPDDHILNRIRKAKLELNWITDFFLKKQFLVQKLCLEIFEQSNRSGRYLANQLKTNKDNYSLC